MAKHDQFVLRYDLNMSADGERAEIMVYSQIVSRKWRQEDPEVTALDFDRILKDAKAFQAADETKLAAAKNGAVLTDTRRLRIKESDRAAAMAEELKKMGVEITVEENRVLIPKGKLQAPTEPLHSHNDHRIAMSLAVLLTLTGGEILQAEAVNKSYPDFYQVLSQLQAKVTLYEAE